MAMACVAVRSARLVLAGMTGVEGLASKDRSAVQLPAYDHTHRINVSAIDALLRKAAVVECMQADVLQCKFGMVTTSDTPSKTDARDN